MVARDVCQCRYLVRYSQPLVKASRTTKAYGPRVYERCASYHILSDPMIECNNSAIRALELAEIHKIFEMDIKSTHQNCVLVQQF